MMPPTTVFGERHVVTIQSSVAGHRKIFSVGFGKDGSVYVYLPYFSETDGILLRQVGRVVNGVALVERKELPHMTSSRVKFSYHPNGRAHFSQTGKVKTVVIGSLPPLLMHDGVLFQVQAYGFDHYALVVPKDSKRVLVDCTPDPDALGVVVTGHISKPGVCAVESAGEPRLVARSQYSSMLIALGYKVLRAPAHYDGAHLIFAGGPSAPAIMAPGAVRSVLSAAYPRGSAPALFPGAESADL